MWERVPRRGWGLASKEKGIPVARIYKDYQILLPKWLLENDPKRCNIYIDRENRLLGVQFSEKGDHRVKKRSHGFEISARRALRALQSGPGLYPVVLDDALLIIDLKQDATRKVLGT